MFSAQFYRIPVWERHDDVLCVLSPGRVSDILIQLCSVVFYYISANKGMVISNWGQAWWRPLHLYSPLGSIWAWTFFQHNVEGIFFCCNHLTLLYVCIAQFRFLRNYLPKASYLHIFCVHTISCCFAGLMDYACRNKHAKERTHRHWKQQKNAFK
jgi:hypothetical protein